MKTKTCTHCMNDLEESQEFFNKDNRTGGYRSKCKSCEKKYREENKEHKRMVSIEYRKAKRDEIRKNKAEYHKKNKETIIEKWHIWKNKNIERYKQYQKEYAEKRKEKKKAYDAQYRKNNLSKIINRQKEWRNDNLEHARRKDVESSNRRRARFLNAEGEYTAKDIEKLYHKQGGNCAYCGKPVGVKYHVDHIVPLSRGGSNYPENLAIACVSCNVRKSNKLLSELGWKLIY